MDPITARSALLAELGRAVGSSAEPGNPSMSPLSGVHAAPALGRRPRTSSLHIRPGISSSAADITSKASARRPSIAKRPSMLTSKHGSDGSFQFSGVNTLEGVKAAAQERWRSLAAGSPRARPKQAPLTPGGLEGQVRMCPPKSLKASLWCSQDTSGRPHVCPVPPTPVSV